MLFTKLLNALPTFSTFTLTGADLSFFGDIFNSTIAKAYARFDWKPHTIKEEKRLSSEAEVFLCGCVIGTLIGLTWLNYYVAKSLRYLEHCILSYDKWYNGLEHLEIESAKWHRLYWMFEKNNMILQRLESPHYWPVKPVSLPPIVPIKFKDRTQIQCKTPVHTPPDIYHAMRPKIQSTMSRLLTDPEYMHSVELYHNYHDSKKVRAREGDWSHFRQVCQFGYLIS